jgi:hypothetical protein
MNQMQIALFDVNAGFLQWIGTADSHKAAIRTHLADIGGPDVEWEILAIDVTDAQADALRAWHESGSDASEYPAGLPNGVRYDARDVLQAMQAECAELRDALQAKRNENVKLRAALQTIASQSPGDEPEPEDYDDTESAYENGHDVAAWEAATVARNALA